MGWYIACGILLALALLPLGIRFGYNSAGVSLLVFAGPVKITVFPRKKRIGGKKAKKKPEKKPDKAASAEEKPPQPPKDATSKDNKPETGGSLERFLPLIKLALDFLGDFRRKLRLNNLYLHVTLAGEDPCDLAVNYGRAWAALGNLLPNLERLFVIKKRDLQVSCDFTASDTVILAKGDITITLGRLVCLAIHYGVRALFEILAMKRKGGVVK